MSYDSLKKYVDLPFPWEGVARDADAEAAVDQEEPAAGVEEGEALLRPPGLSHLASHR